MNDTFPEKWIGRDGPIPWPPRFSDITPLDFFLWGYVKDIVYRIKVRDVSDLQQRIIEALDTVTVDIRAGTRTEPTETETRHHVASRPRRDFKVTRLETRLHKPKI